MGRLTTHVLDVSAGVPAASVTIELFTTEPTRRRLRTCVTNADGRCDEPLLAGDALVVGVYDLVFHAGRYFAARRVPLSTPPFIDEIVVRVGIADPGADHHVPLLVAPWSYTAYRGS